MRLIATLILFISSLGMYAQQGFQYSQYMLDKYQFNPAYGGLERSLHINAVVRSQWNGIEDNPQSQYINAHLPFYIWNGSIGMSLHNETSGALRNIHLSGSYNYVIKNELGIFSFGLSAGLIQKSINGTRLITPDGDYIDNTFNHNDPALTDQEYNGISPTWTLGFYYAGLDFDAGISIANVPAPSLSAGQSNFSVSSHSTLYGEYRYRWNNNLVLIPNVLVKTDFVEYQTDFSVMGRYNGNIFGSIGLRGYNSNSIDALIFMMGTKLSPKYSVAYSYDAGLSSIKRVNEGTHEIRLIYNLNKLIRTGMPPKIIYNPRHL
ncbi:MAG: PorP/SprF family type IX secretion system membrane protein [Saprospiraceae bacterium]|nr:PorP/SprF family type IX secretion system membrane protein [Saprospiraceae bacterium]